jgi:hypothetical protein
MKKILLVLLAFGMLFASIPQQALESYYAAFMQEDIDAFMGSTCASNRTASQISDTRELVSGLWQHYNTDAYAISGLECIEEGEDSLCQYMLHAEISGAETLSYDLEYLALLHKESGEWRVCFAMPLDEYLETREEQEKLAVVDAMLDDEHELYFKEPLDGPKYATFNGQPLQDLSPELDDMLYSCYTDEYCQKNGYGDYCQSGTCFGSSGSAEDGWEEVEWEGLIEDGNDSQPPPGETGACGGAVAFLLLPLILFIKKNK